MALRNKDFQRMYGRAMIKFILGLKTEDLANIKVPAEANPIKGERSKVKGRAGGKPPVDYTAIEMKVDMEQDLLHGRYRQAYTTYVTLMRLTNTGGKER